jgi:hypothetical protein
MWPSKKLIEAVLLCLRKKETSDDFWYIEDKIKDKNKLQYQVLSAMYEDMLKKYIETY